MLYGLWIWNERPDAFLTAGAAIVVAAGLYILHRETVLARERSRAAALAALRDRYDDKPVGG
jgi:drug/metabolite transporter (DMT)-like permease